MFPCSRWAPTVLSVLLAGCYLSHGRDGVPRDAAPESDTRVPDVDAAPTCVRDLECDDSAPCTIDRCEGGRCVFEPTPMQLSATFDHSAHYAVASHDGLAWILGEFERDGAHGLAVVPYDLDGPAGAAIALDAPPSGRVWDSDIVSMGDELAVVTAGSEGAYLRRLSDPLPFAVSPDAGIFVQLAWTGRHLVVTTDESGSSRGFGVLFADATPTYTGTYRTDGIIRAQVHSTGHPPRLTAVGTSPDEARYLSVDADGRVSHLRARPDSPMVERASLPSEGPPLFHSFVAAEGGAALGAQWVQTEDDEVRHVYLAAFELPFTAPTLRPIAPPLIDIADDDPYSLHMATAHCAERFLAVHGRNDGLQLRQLDERGRELGTIERLGPGITAARLGIACVPGGAIVITWSQTYALRCR